MCGPCPPLLLLLHLTAAHLHLCPHSQQDLRSGLEIRWLPRWSTTDQQCSTPFTPRVRWRISLLRMVRIRVATFATFPVTRNRVVMLKRLQQRNLRLALLPSVPPSSGALTVEEISVELEFDAFPSKAAQPHPSSSPDSLS